MGTYFLDDGNGSGGVDILRNEVPRPSGPPSGSPEGEGSHPDGKLLTLDFRLLTHDHRLLTNDLKLGT